MELIAATGETECLPALAGFVVRPGVLACFGFASSGNDSKCRLAARCAPRSGSGPADSCDHSRSVASGCYAAEFERSIGRASKASRRTGGLARPAETWRIRRAALSVGGEDLEPGDWLLMRNPSPYNLFTDLSPGLFTHVGVVTLEKGSDGIQRMVLVDLPERGNRMPATNIDTFLERSRHYLFLRYPDSEIGRRMGDTAASLIGSEAEFDLTFRTDRVAELAGQPLAGKKITTYCAGLLLLCALETGHGREEFFPIPEGAAGGETVDNLAQLGISFGRDFISPTGGLFSPRLKSSPAANRLMIPTRSGRSDL